MRVFRCVCGNLIPYDDGLEYMFTLEDDEPFASCEKCLRLYENDEQVGTAFYIRDAGSQVTDKSSEKSEEKQRELF